MHIQLESINFYYGSHQVLFDVTLQFSEGETVVFLGPSGAGKSSLLRVFNLLEIPCSGSLQIAGQQFKFNQLLQVDSIRQLRRQVGIIFQQYHLWPHMTVMQNLIEAPRRVLGLGKNQIKYRAEKLLMRLNLTNFANRFPAHLSSGQQQRVAIARALMMEPKVLLFDEPTAALDPGIRAQIFSIINELSASGITQFIVTHEVEVARKIARRVVYMENGHVIEQGDKSCFTNPKTEAFANYLSY